MNRPFVPEQGAKADKSVPSDRVLEICSCPVCGSGQFVVIAPSSYPPSISRDELLAVYKSSSEQRLMDQLVRCTMCGLAYLNPRPRGDIILDSYSNAVDPVFAAQNPMRIATFKRTFERLARRHDIALSRATRVIDVGCAGGAFPKAAHDLGCSVVGIEPSRWLSKVGREEFGLDIRSGILSDFAFEEASFDVVTLWDVIEHLLDPNEVLAEVQRILKPGGHLVVNYPDYGSVAARLLGRRWPFLLSVHLFYFTRATITRLLKRAGFEVVEIRPFFQTLSAGYVAHRAKAYVSRLGRVEEFLRASSLGTLPFTYNMGQSLMVARSGTS